MKPLPRIPAEIGRLVAWAAFIAGLVLTAFAYRYVGEQMVAAPNLVGRLKAASGSRSRQTLGP
jgi:hypothetical protein